MSSASYGTLLRVPGALPFTLSAALGRLPLSMVTLGALLLVEDQTGSYAVGGTVSAALALGAAAINPAVSRLMDQLGQAAVIPGAIALHVAGMVGLVALALGDAWAPFLVLAAIVSGGALPPIGSCARARWSFVLERAGRPDDVPTAMAWESVVDEVVFVVGPVLVIAAATAVDPVAGLVLALLAATSGSLALAAQHATQPEPTRVSRHAASALHLAGLRTLVLVGLGIGTLFGGLEVSMVAFADARDAAGAAGVLLGLFAFGSGIAGLVYGARHWLWPLDRRLLVGSAVLVLGTAPLLIAPPVALMAVLSFVAGVAVAPTLIASFGLVQRLVPGGLLTEGFTWVNSGIGVGAAAGSALAGLLADHAATRWPFAVCCGGALLALLLATTLRNTLREPCLPDRLSA